VFNFAVRPDMLRESHIDIFSKREYLRIEMGEVEIVEANKAIDNDRK